MGLVQRANLPVWRSLMFVPVNVDRFVQKAAGCGADAIVLDLEDSIAPKDKAVARTLVSDAAHIVGQQGSDIVVRINRPLDMAVRDIEEVVSAPVTALMIPKIESAGHVRLLCEFIGQIETRRGLPIGHTRLYCVVESVCAFPHMFEIAAADPRIVAFTCGTEDFTATCGAQPDPDVLRYPKQQGVIAARAAGVIPLGIFASSANFKDSDGYRRAVAESRRFGVEGSACIHPSQVPILNEGFSPSELELTKARRVVDAYEAATAAGRGSIGLDGQMLDVPVVERAQRLIEMSDRIAARNLARRRR